MTETIVFGDRDAARKIRNDPKYKPFLAESDDGREATVRLKESTPEAAVAEITGEAAETREKEAEKFGQVPLTDAERDRIDFTETTVPEARAAKGIAAGKGVDDFVSHFDETLTVDEHREVFERAKQEGGGRRDVGRETGSNAKRLAAANKERKRAAGDRVRRFALEKADESAQQELRSRGRFSDVFDVDFTRRDGRLIGQGADFERLATAHEKRSARARSIDERRSAAVTRDPIEWVNHKSTRDFPGIDTVQPRELHAERPRDERQADEREFARLANSKEQWAQNQGELDWFGVDTPDSYGPTMGKAQPIHPQETRSANRVGVAPEDMTITDDMDVSGVAPEDFEMPFGDLNFEQRRGVEAGIAPADQEGVDDSDGIWPDADDRRFAGGQQADRAFLEAEGERASDDPTTASDLLDDRPKNDQLTSFGMETDATQHRESRTAEAEASEFGVDDRTDPDRGATGDGDGGEQRGFEEFGGGVRENERLF